MAREHELIINLPLENPLVEPEEFWLNPENGPDAPDAKSPYKLGKIYPDIADFRTIDPSVYSDREYAQREWDQMFTKTWLLAGRASDCKEVGDWFRYDIGPESIIIIRGTDKRIKAFYNVCKHRGNRLVMGEFGNSTAIGCVFHSWLWDIDGNLKRATDRETFRPEALCGDLNLSKVHVAEWAGFVFVSMADEPIPFDTFICQEMRDACANYNMEDWHIVKQVQLDVDLNWKAVADSFQEIYHVHMLHPGGRGNVDEHFCQYDYYPYGHNRMLVPFGLVSHRLPNRSEITPVMAGFMRDCGIDPDTYTGDIANGDARRDMQKAKRVPNNKFGLDFSEYTDAQLTDDWNFSIFPGVTFNVHVEGTIIQRFRPSPDLDPNKAIYDVTVICPAMNADAGAPWYFGLEPSVDVTGTGPRPVKRYTNMENTEVGALLDEDVVNFGRQRMGLRSRGLDWVRLSEQEGRCQQMYAEVEYYIRGVRDVR